MVVSGNTEVLKKTTITRRVLKGAFCMRVALLKGTHRRLRSCMPYSDGWGSAHASPVTEYGKSE